MNFNLSPAFFQRLYVNDVTNRGNMYQIVTVFTLVTVMFMFFFDLSPLRKTRCVDLVEFYNFRTITPYITTTHTKPIDTYPDILMTDIRPSVPQRAYTLLNTVKKKGKWLITINQYINIFHYWKCWKCADIVLLYSYISFWAWLSTVLTTFISFPQHITR